ncbi:uncharacterized protein MELLADRAFT_72041, partial [Melampsora larici-populina 98AG31]
MVTTKYIPFSCIFPLFRFISCLVSRSLSCCSYITPIILIVLVSTVYSVFIIRIFPLLFAIKMVCMNQLI